MKQFLNALTDAKGIELDGTGNANEQNESSSASYPIAVQLNASMDTNKIVAVKRAPTTAKPQLLSQRLQQSETEAVQQPQIEQPEQPEPVGHVESLTEPLRDDSIYGSGWNLAQLMNEFSERTQG